MTDTLTIRKHPGSFVVRAGGAVLGESNDVLEVSEGNLDPVLYFPRSDIAMAFLDRTETQTNCPKKGDASYYSIVTKSTTIEDAAWSYEAPIEAAERLATRLAFAKRNDVAVEEL